jgi:hypothetical protein
MIKPFILECSTKEEANMVDRLEYVFDGFSEHRQVYIFHLRRQKDLEAR